MHYSRYPRFLQLYIYTYTLSYIIYLGEPPGNIISNYHGTFIHIFMHGYDTKKKILNSFLCQCCCFICQGIFFLANVTSNIFHFLQVEFSWVDIIKASVMSSTTSQYSSTFHSFFIKENTGAETETKLDFISSIWDNDHIMMLDEKKLAIIMV